MRDQTYHRVLTAAAFALAGAEAARTTLGADYPTDAGPSLSAMAHGNVAGFFAHQPAMGPLSLYLRAPFVLLAAALHDGPLGLYRWGSLPLMLAVAAIAVLLARHAAQAGTGRLGQTLIVVCCLVNPLIGDALYWGHPEELLTASLAVGSLLAACEGRSVLAAVLVGLAVASKQWAIVIVVPVLLILGRDQLRVLLMSGAVAVLAWLPMAVNLSAARHALAYISHPQPVVTIFTWLYPFSPRGVVTVSNIFGDARTFQVHRLLAGEAVLLRPLIVLIGVGVPLLVGWRLRGRGGAEPILLATGLAIILRCALDPGTAAYYHLPLLLVVVALDATTGRRFPVASLAAVGLAFVVLDRFPAYLGTSLANGLYIAATVLACAVLLRRLHVIVSGARSVTAADTRAAPALFPHTA